jgi:hypothetical protein
MSTAADFEKARQLQAQGFSASYIAGKTGLSAEQARNVVERQAGFAGGSTATSSSSSTKKNDSPGGGSLAADFEKARQLYEQGYGASYIAGKTGLDSQQAKNVVERQTAFGSAASGAGTSTGTTNTSTGTINTSTGEATGGGGGVFPLEAQMAALGAELQNRSSISNYGWDAQKVIAQLQDAGQTERQKLINENNLAVTGAEVKGKLDLQAIVNAGYKNIANIERGSNMFSSIMSAFNF